jgi:hypothetical protein
MAEPVDREDSGAARSRRQRLDLLYGSHLALVAALGIGRLLRAVEAAGAANESSFAASWLGRALALAAMVAGIPALVAVLLETAREHRDPKALLLLVLLACALVSRRGPDAFDILYVLGALALSALWFAHGRRSCAPGRPLERESV